ncbi:MAG: AMP-binding protein, partial [Actinomycetota bacterium]|nr:AMP-binding protein [Actinomycetota bacterium]
MSIEPRDPPGPPRDEFALHALFAYWTRHTPAAPAVIDAAGTHTYGQVWRRSGRIAARLLELGVHQDEVVATLLPRSAQQVAALLGILRAGGALLALDRAQLGARGSALVADAGVRVV